MSTSNNAQWTDVLAEHQLTEGGRWFARRGGHEIALFRIQGSVHAIADSCPHNGASLATGQLEGTTIKCRAHGLRFDMATGCPRGAVGLSLRTYPTRVHDGRVEVHLGAAAGCWPSSTNR